MYYGFVDKVKYMIILKKEKEIKKKREIVFDKLSYIYLMLVIFQKMMDEIKIES